MKTRKLLLVVLLIAALTLPLCSASAEPTFMRQLTQDKYVRTNLLTTDSYPEVCISPYYFDGAYISQYNEPYYIRFACPVGTFVNTFDERSAHFLDMANNRQYTYTAQETAAYETFINKSDKDEYILADGSDGVAIYLDPDSERAYALLSASAIDRNCKLQITIQDDGLSNLPVQQVIDTLSKEITEEAARVKNAMRIEKMDTFWSQGKFSGFDLICLERNANGLAMNYTLPSGYFITTMDDNSAEIAICNGKDNGLTVEISLDTYSYVDYQVENKPENVSSVQINGEPYRVYTNWYNDSRIMSVYVDRVLTTTAGYNKDDTVYFTLELRGDGQYEWTSMEDMLTELGKIVAGAEILQNQATLPTYRDAAPYTDAPVATEAPQAPAPTAGVPANPGATFTFRNGLHWGMTPEEVLAAEGQAKFVGTSPVNERIVGYTLRATVSQYNVTGMYYFVDNSLAAVEFFRPNASQTDVDYLGQALSQVYGQPQVNAPILYQLAQAVTAVRGSIAGYETAEYSWLLDGGNVIQLFLPGDYFDLFYGDGTVDLEAALSNATPAPAFNTNGL